VAGEFGVFLKRLTPPRHSREREPWVREQARSYEKPKRIRSGFWTSREIPERTGTPLQKAERNRRSGGHATWMSREPRWATGTYARGGRLVRASVAGEFVRVARLCRARMSGQAFLVSFCGGGLPPFDKRDSPEGAKQDGRADSVRRRNTQAKATGLFPFGPAQVLFAAMTRLRPEWGKLREPSHNPK